MKQKISMDILKQVDEAAEERIAEEFPVNWEKEEIFERAYRNYLEQTQGIQAPAAPIWRHAMRIVSAVACCILVLGAAYTIRIAPRQIPTLPDETTTETVSPTPENAENLTTAPAETEPTEGSFSGDEAMPGNDGSLPEAAASVPAAATEAGSIPGVADVTEPSFTEAAPAGTSVQTAGVSGTIPSAVTGTARSTGVTQTLEAEEGFPFTESPRTASPTDGGGTLSGFTEPEIQTDCGQPETEAVTAPTETRVAAPGTPVLPGFEVKQKDGNLEITYQEELTPSPDRFNSYWPDPELFGYSNPESGSKGTRKSYDVRLKSEDYWFTVMQLKRTVFRQTCSEDALLLPADVNGYPAYFVIVPDLNPGSSCTLYWDDGYYTFKIKDTVRHQEAMLLLARSFKYADR